MTIEQDHRSHAEQVLGIAPGLFPFERRFVDVDGARMHYVDEGDGPTLLMVHGNPTWSLLFRHLIRELRGEYRCITIDQAGFGLSRPPASVSMPGSSRRFSLDSSRRWTFGKRR